MAVLACLQMEAFALPTSMGLWIDVLFNTAIAKISEHTAIYEAGFITTVIVRIDHVLVIFNDSGD